MKTHWIGVGIVLLFAVAGLGFIVTSPEGLFNRHSDLVAEHIATQTVFHDSWTRGEGVPLWRDDQLSGAPAFTNPQAAYSHPVHALFAFFVPARIVGLVIWLDLVVAAMGVYLAAAALKLTIPGRVLAATAALFSFKAIIAAYAGWMPQLSAVAALPFAFAATLIVLERRSRASVVGLALAGALALHGAHPQLIYYTGVFIALWCGVRLAHEVRVNASAAARSLAALLAGAALALGLAAYRLLPIATDLPLVTRSDATREFFFDSARLVPQGLLTVFYPEYFGTPLNDTYGEAWEYILYLGVVPTLLAVFGFVAGRKQPHVTALRAGLLLSIALAIDSPLLRLVSHVVPGYSLFRMPARVLFLTAFFGYCLAGVGLDAVLARVPPRTRRAVAVLLVAAVALEGSYWARRYLLAPDPVPLPATAPYIEALRITEPARIAPLSTATPNYGSGSLLGLQLVTGYDPFIFRHYQTYLDVVQSGRAAGARSTVWANLDAITRWDLLDALNVAFVVSPAPIDSVPPRYRLSQSFQEQEQFRFYEGVVRGPVYVYRNDQPLQRAFFVSSVRAAPSEDVMLVEVLQRNLRDEAVTLAGPEGDSKAALDDRVDVRRAARGDLELTATSAHRRFLVISEVWHPGWTATVDGTPATLHRTNIALQGLWLDPGTHHIRIRFWPTGLSAGLIVTGVTISALLVYLGLALRGQSG